MPHRPWPILAAIAICLLLLACFSAPPTSQSDTSFTDARNNFKASDFGAKTPAGQSHSGSYYNMRSDYYNTARSFLMNGMQAVMDQRSKLRATPLPSATSNSDMRKEKSS